MVLVEAGRQVSALDAVPRDHDHQPLHQVLQLPDVSGPAIVSDNLHRRVGNVFGLAAVSAGELLEIELIAIGAGERQSVHATSHDLFQHMRVLAISRIKNQHMRARIQPMPQRQEDRVG